MRRKKQQEDADDVPVFSPGNMVMVELHEHIDGLAEKVKGTTGKVRADIKREYTEATENYNLRAGKKLYMTSL